MLCLRIVLNDVLLPLPNCRYLFILFRGFFFFSKSVNGDQYCAHRSGEWLWIVWLRWKVLSELLHITTSPGGQQQTDAVTVSTCFWANTLVTAFIKRSCSPDDGSKFAISRHSNNITTFRISCAIAKGISDGPERQSTRQLATDVLVDWIARTTAICALRTTSVRHDVVRLSNFLCFICLSFPPPPFSLNCNLLFYNIICSWITEV